MATVLNVKIGESKAVPRVWLEGKTLESAGLQIGSTYAFEKLSANRIELRPAEEGFSGQTFMVSSRKRPRGPVHPLMEIRTTRLREVFEGIEKVSVRIEDGHIVITASRLDVSIVRRALRLLTKVSGGLELSMVSVFHGGGVLDKAMHHGMAREGVQSYVKVAVEMEELYLASSLRNNPELFRPDSVAVRSDIRDVDWNDLGESDLFWGGIPCTGASISGRSKNKLKAAEEHLDAGTLFIDFIEGVKAQNPAICGFENVSEYQNTLSMMVLRSRLDLLGYDLYEMVLNGNTFGALERRNRLVVVGVCRGLKTRFDVTDVTPVRAKEASLRDILEHVPLDSPRWRSSKGLDDKVIRDKADGKGFMPQRLTGDEGHCGTIGKGYMKRRSTEPFIVHPEIPGTMRLLTPLEHSRVKGIPEGVAAGEPDSVAHEIYGQSVVYPKIEAVGAALGRFIMSAVSKVAVTSLRPVARIAGDVRQVQAVQYALPGLAVERAG